MSQLPPAHLPSQDPSATAPVEPGFDVTVQAFWDKNRGAVLLGIAAVFVAILGWQGWKQIASSREAGVREEYAQIGDQTSKLAAFADAHSGHELGGVARLRLADENFSSAKYAEALDNYNKAAGSLKNGALLGRAKLGAAVSQLNSGAQAAGEAALKGISTDTALPTNVRAEATYHLATLALDAGKKDEAKQLAEEVSRIDANGPWSQRATMLLASLPASATPAANNAAGLTFKPGN